MSGLKQRTAQTEIDTISRVYKSGDCLIPAGKPVFLRDEGSYGNNSNDNDNNARLP